MKGMETKMKRLFIFLVVTALVGLASSAGADILPTEHDGTTGGSGGVHPVTGDECCCITVGCPYWTAEWGNSSEGDFAPPTPQGSVVVGDLPPSEFACIEMCCREDGMGLMARFLRHLQGWNP